VAVTSRSSRTTVPKFYFRTTGRHDTIEFAERHGDASCPVTTPEMTVTLGVKPIAMEEGLTSPSCEGGRDRGLRAAFVKDFEVRGTHGRTTVK